MMKRQHRGDYNGRFQLMKMTRLLETTLWMINACDAEKGMFEITKKPSSKLELKRVLVSL